MTDKELRSKYPDVWDNVESSMIEWLTSTANMPGLYIDLYKDDPENSKLGIIAHNAAFAACVELHRYLKTNQTPPIDEGEILKHILYRKFMQIIPKDRLNVIIAEGYADEVIEELTKKQEG